MGKRYQNDVTISWPAETAERIIGDFFDKEGFVLADYKGERVWKKGVGLMTAPQFVKTSCRQGSVQIEAWLKFAILPGVYCGEMGLNGFWGFAVKQMLRGRVEALIALLQQPSGQGGAEQIPARPAAAEQAEGAVQSKPKDAVKSLADSAAPAAQSEAATAVTQPDSPAVSALENAAERLSDTGTVPTMQNEPVAAEATQPVPPKMHDPVNKATLSLVMGLVSIVTWLIPLGGLATSIIGIVSAVPGMRSSARGRAVAGLVLSIIFLVISVVAWMINLAGACLALSDIF